MKLAAAIEQFEQRLKGQVFQDDIPVAIGWIRRYGTHHAPDAKTPGAKLSSFLQTIEEDERREEAWEALAGSNGFYPVMGRELPGTHDDHDGYFTMMFGDRLERVEDGIAVIDGADCPF